MPAIENPTDQEACIHTEDKKYALIVGINNSLTMPYRPTLKFAEKDAEDIAYHLKQPECNFTLLIPAFTGEKATTGNIKQGVIELVKKRKEEDFLLFYYAGHAVAINNDIYLVTYDFQEENVELDPDLYLSMRWLWRILYQSVGAGRVLLVLDCCYAGTIVDTREDPFKIDLGRLLKEWDAGFSGKDQKNCLRLILTATGYNVHAQELDGHGLLSGLLLKALHGEEDDALDKEGQVEIGCLYRYLRNKMPIEQQPDLSGKFGPYNCILASHPHRTERLRQQMRENEIKNDIERGILSELFRLHAETQHTQPFDHSICYNATFSELDQGTITEFLKQERVQQEIAFYPNLSAQDQLLEFGFLKNSNPTYGTLLCFGRNPSKWVSGATTRCVDWGSNLNPDRMQDSREFGDGLLRQFELSRDFLRKSLRLHRVIGRQGSTEEWELPLRVLDEALANALVHREYANRTDSMCVEVYDDRIEICSPGTLPSPMTEELLQVKHKSIPRNPQIAGIFYLHGYIEKFGTGIQRMQRFMEEAGLQAPEFKLNGDKTFTVVLRRPQEVQDISNRPIQRDPNPAVQPKIKSIGEQTQQRSNRSVTDILSSAISRQELVCPFCFTKFKAQDTRYRCVNPTCIGMTPDALYAHAHGIRDIPPMGRVLVPKSHLFRSSHSAVCDVCKTESLTPLCPQCHFELPHDIAHTEQSIIAIIGGRNVGKSHYIATLIQTLQHKVGSSFDFSLLALGDDTRRRWQEDFYRPLFEMKSVLQSTQSGTVDAKVKAPLIFRLIVMRGNNKRAVNISFFDTAGEDMASLSTMSTQARYISQADAMIVLLDPLQIQSIRRLLPSANLPALDPTNSLEQIVSRLRDLYERTNSLPPSKKIKIPVAFTLSKVDALQSIVAPSSPLLHSSEHTGSLELAAVQSMSTEIANYLSDWINPNFCHSIEQGFASYCYFGVSSLGAQPDVNNHLQTINPIHVEDPFLWILYKLNLIRGRR